MRSKRITPGPGQESVWDYPRPPRVERSGDLLVIEHGGVKVAESREAWRVLETSHPPVYYIPQKDIDMASIIEGFTTAQIAVMTSAQIAALTTEDWAAFSTAQIVALTPTQIPAISTLGLRALSTSQISAFEPTDVSAFSGSQVASLATQQVQALSSAQ
ncbi:MAG: DUF427 domain-containing protein, partial [Chloroflexaceae bacterium]|nr:DUF427 domain-containing protein [Chloroflexaceae bacterium]